MQASWLVAALVLALGTSCERGSSPADAGPRDPDARAPLDDAGPDAQAPDPVAPDLILELPPDRAAARLVARDVAADACTLFEGCVRGSGQRSLLELALLVRNVGATPLELGAPWASALFHPSPCQSSYVLDGFLGAALWNERGVVAEAQLATSCVSRDDGTYSCAAQGLAAGEASLQPRSQCAFMDVTWVEPGLYTLSLTVNPAGALSERDLTNNSLSLPIVIPECAGTRCGEACCPSAIACVDDVCQLPDLHLHAGAAAESLTIAYRGFGENACELEEMCVGGPGRRRLLMFESRVENLGPGDLDAGDPLGNPLFEFSLCHAHYHFKDFSDYRLVTTNGAVVAQGHKQSFCLIDMARIEDYQGPAPPGTHPVPTDRCNVLSAGWADIYAVGTPCQWIDITGVPEGDYWLELSLNGAGRIAEMDTDNNLTRIPVHVPAEEPCVAAPENCGNSVDDDCDGFSDKEDLEDCEPACAPDGCDAGP